MEHSIDYRVVPREMFTAIDALVKSHNALFKDYVDQLFWWNDRINLISRGVSRETILAHIRHSLLISQLDVFKKAPFIVDAGTGGGLPGIPLAITNPEKHFILNDIVTKKIMAIRQIERKLNLKNTEGNDNSIKDLIVEKPFLMISKHAFKINDLIKLTYRLPWSKIVMLKGKDFEGELTNIGDMLSISVHDLYTNAQNEFYKDKIMLVISR